ncbi:MAG TPA: hypothetical protein DDY22_19960 [Geobacter sp.]|nr:hypothetical protein [Geobacter sp.]
MATTSGRGSGHSPANVTKNLKGIDFPAGKQDLLKQAQHLKAEQIVIDEIQRLDDRQYNSMADVMKSFGAESKSERPSSSRSSTSESGQKAGQSKSHAKPTHHR